MAGNPVLIGAATVLVILVAVFLSYNANKGLPFVPTYQVKEFAPDVTLGGSASREPLIALALGETWSRDRDLMTQPRRNAVYYASIRSTGDVGAACCVRSSAGVSGGSTSKTGAPSPAPPSSTGVPLSEPSFSAATSSSLSGTSA